MASNYNRVPKSGVAAVTSTGFIKLVSRQSFQDTFINDIKSTYFYNNFFDSLLLLKYLYV